MLHPLQILTRALRFAEGNTAPTGTLSPLFKVICVFLCELTGFVRPRKPEIYGGLVLLVMFKCTHSPDRDIQGHCQTHSHMHIYTHAHTHTHTHTHLQIDALEMRVDCFFPVLSVRTIDRALWRGEATLDVAIR